MKIMILAIDPGSDKCGLAVLDYNKYVHYRGIIATPTIETYLQDLLNKLSIESIIIGDGTHSAELKEKFENQFAREVTTVDESHTTEEAEKRYRAENYGLVLKILSTIVSWKPGKPVDDYVAIILAERYIDVQESH